MKYIFFISFLLGLSLISCSSNQDESSALNAFYEESLSLQNTSLDSICVFAEKFYEHTKSGSYDNDPLYEPIVKNIDSSKHYFLNCEIWIDTVWAGGTTIEF